MARLEIRTSDELIQQLMAAKPKSLSLSSFCALLLESQLTRGSKLPAYRVGAGNFSTTSTAAQPTPEHPEDLDACSEHTIVSAQFGFEHTHLADGVGKGLQRETPRKVPLTPGEGLQEVVAVPQAQLGKPRSVATKGEPAFEAFWSQYQAIKRRASAQSKPKALVMWQQVRANGTTPEQLRAALTAALTQQRTIERDGGHPSPFPDCFRWLRDGYYEAFIPKEEDSLAVVGVSSTEIRDPNHPDF